MDFLRDNTRFSFLYGGKNAFENEYERSVVQDGDILTVTYTFKDGLKITNTGKKYEKYGAYEWVNYIENTSDKPSDIISGLFDCDITLPIEHEEVKKKESYLRDIYTSTRIFAPKGSTWRTNDFSSDADVMDHAQRPNHIYAGGTKTYATSGGRSSDKQAPFFNIHKNGKGYIFAIGWSGQWKSEIIRSEDDVTFKSGIENVNFRLLPGEAFRTSSVVVMPYESDVCDSQNKWRRFIKEHFSLIGKDGRDACGPLSAMVWGGMKSEQIIDRVKKIEENNIPIEYIWIDAGWYGTAEPSPDEFEGDWSKHTGDWRISYKIHPDGMKDVSKAIHDSGRKFLLWLEPERVVRTAPILKEHPEYFIAPEDEECNNFLLNLGSEEAWNYCCKTLSDLIGELSIDCYRQDFNFDPLPYWLKNDAPDRVGISEIKHINGMYRLWDTLLEKYPLLIIDNCASGGKRIDIETLKRSMPMWRNDFQCNANYDIEGAQCHHMSYNVWIPYSGTGTGRGYDEYRVRSAYDASMGINHSYSAKEEFCDTKEKIDFLKKYMEEYLRVRPYFSADYYPLTEMTPCLDAWCAVQFDRPEEKDGIIQVFKREKSSYTSASFTLRKIKAGSKYLFTDADGAEEIISGDKLIEEGFCITINEKPKAKLFFYKEI